jgi:FtsP/CotA-like multicopper oxidase with cupredoxin domain
MTSLAAAGVCALLTLGTWAEGERAGNRAEDQAAEAPGRTVLPGQSLEVNLSPLRFLCQPDGEPLEYEAHPSPKAMPFKDSLFIPPVKQPENDPLSPAPDPSAHQRYAEFPPKKFYVNHEQEIRWVYHSDAPYDKGTWSWGIDGTTPGPTFHARYGEPILVRRFNDLTIEAVSHVKFGLPSTTRHLHNAHTASESDGFPDDWIEPGEFQDHHYGNFPSGFDDREKLTTLWYHDHRLDSTAANVYAGLVGFYLLFDEQDSGNENDPSPKAWRLPSGKYDIPLVLHDLLFDQDGQLAFNRRNTGGILGDRYTVNRIIQPRLEVEARKYRFRLLNGGPSRFYQLFLGKNGSDTPLDHPFIVITGDGNLQPEPLETTSVYMGVAQRVDVILDFSKFKHGDQLYLENRLEQYDGRGPSGRLISNPGANNHQHQLMRFDVVAAKGKDNSRIPARFRDFPPVNLSEVRRERVWNFDNIGGHWLVNGQLMDPNRIDAGIDQDAPEIWSFRNTGNKWLHPIHSHFTEFIILEVNGAPVYRDEVQVRPRVRGLRYGDPKRQPFERVFQGKAGATDEYILGTNVIQGQNATFMGGLRRDVALLLPNTEMKVYMRWKDFLGRYVLHCHNVVHEDHAMMIRWDILPPGKGFEGSRPASQVYGAGRNGSRRGGQSALSGVSDRRLSCPGCMHLNVELGKP